MTQFTDDELAALRTLFDAARSGDVDVLAPLLRDGMTPNLTNDRGDTLLILAAYHRRADVVRLLLEYGADHGRVNDQGQTALGAAVFRQERETVGDLLAAGADPDAGIRSARDIAAFFGLDDMVSILPASSSDAHRPSEAPGRSPGLSAPGDADGSHDGPPFS